MDRDQKHFIFRKLHSLTGVIPLAFFLLEHLFVNGMAIHSGEKFNQAVELIESLPLLLALEFGFIMIPLFYHGLYGLFVTTSMTVNTGGYGYFRNYMYVLQRVTGVIAFVYVCVHLWDFRIQKAIDSAFLINFDTVAAHYANPAVLAFNVIGVGAVVIHFANGLWNFLIAWGITVGRNSQKVSAAACGLIGAGVMVLAIWSLVSFR